MRTWRRPDPVDLPESLVQAAGSRPVAELLFRRGLRTAAAIEGFLTGGINVDAPGLPDLEIGVAHLVRAITAGERICVYGDYDTDGITSTTLLASLLTELGASVEYYIPNRFRDGYGMNRRAVEGLAQAGVRLILTCDCGIRNLEEVAAARALGLTVVVTDHHELGPDLPNAHAVINPKRLPADHSCHMLPGVGTAYLVARQLLRALDREPEGADRWLDLVAVGIIADVVPLTGANRELARRGLSRIHSAPCAGLQALLEVSGLQGHPDEEELAFQVIPRLNSAGRLADASLGVRLLLAGDPDEARELAVQLDQLNQERRKLTGAVVESAGAEVREGSPAILLFRGEWHEGVLGIAAGRLAEQHGVPTLLMARRHGSGMLVGSARAPAGFPLHEALQSCGEYLVKYGGHAAAAGFSLLEERLPAFRAAMLEEVRRRTRPGPGPSQGEADLLLPLEAVTRELYEDLRRAAPFGEAHPAPVLCAEQARVLSARPIGRGDRHLRLVLRDGERSLSGLWWGAGAARLEPGEFELFYRLGLNRYNGEELLQVVVEHLGLAPEAASAAPREARGHPGLELVDLRGQEFDPSHWPEALVMAEGPTAWSGSDQALDRYRLRIAPLLALLSPPPSPRLFEEALALTGAHRILLAWRKEETAETEHFLPSLMRRLAWEIQQSPYVSISRLAVAMAELESTVRQGIDALVESDLLAVDEEGADVLRLRPRSDGRGMRDSAHLRQMKSLLAESRSYRRFLRTAAVAAIARSLR